MATELIKLEDDDLLIEIENPNNEVMQISGGLASSVEGSIDMVESILKKAISPIKNSFDELNKDMNIEKAEISLGVGFSADGNLFIAKGSAKANLNIKVVLTPK